MFSKTIRDLQDPEHYSYLEWVGGNFDLEAFNIDAINAALRSSKRRPAVNSD